VRFCVSEQVAEELGEPALALFGKTWSLLDGPA